MQSVLNALPSRALVLRPGRGATAAWVLALCGMLLFGGFLAMVTIEVLPGIRTDLAIRDGATPAPQVRVSDGRCRSRLFMFQDCEVTLRWRGKDGQLTRTMHYMFVEPHMGSWSVTPMMNPAQPDLVTTDLALDRLTNRIATVIGWVVFAVLLIGGGFLAAWKAQGKSREVKALSGRVLQPIAVTFDGMGAQGASWRVRDEAGATYEWPVRRKDKPFVLDDQRGLVLALRPPEGGPAFPLDDRLRFVVLTPEERARIEAARSSPVAR
jgi:hypothetical protein